MIDEIVVEEGVGIGQQEDQTGNESKRHSKQPDGSLLASVFIIGRPAPGDKGQNRRHGGKQESGADREAQEEATQSMSSPRSCVLHEHPAAGQEEGRESKGL